MPWSHECMRQLGFMPGLNPGNSNNALYSGWKDISLQSLSEMVPGNLCTCRTKCWNDNISRKTFAYVSTYIANGFIISWITVDKHVVFENAIAHVARSFRRRRRKHAEDGLCQIHLISDKEWNSDVAAVTNSYKGNRYYKCIRVCDIFLPEFPIAKLCCPDGPRSKICWTTNFIAILFNKRRYRLMKTEALKTVRTLTVERNPNRRLPLSLFLRERECDKI